MALARLHDTEKMPPDLAAQVKSRYQVAETATKFAHFVILYESERDSNCTVLKVEALDGLVHTARTESQLLRTYQLLFEIDDPRAPEVAKRLAKFVSFEKK